MVWHVVDPTGGFAGRRELERERYTIRVERTMAENLRVVGGEDGEELEAHASPVQREEHALFVLGLGDLEDVLGRAEVRVVDRCEVDLPPGEEHALHRAEQLLQLDRVFDRVERDADRPRARRLDPFGVDAPRTLR